MGLGEGERILIRYGRGVKCLDNLERNRIKVEVIESEIFINMM